MEYKCIKIEERENFAIITMVRGDKLNPLDTDSGSEIFNAIDTLEKKSSIRAILLTGEGRAFSAGGDVKGMLKSIEDGNPDKYMDDLTADLYKIALKLRQCPKPVIAAVNGYAMGAGMNLALSCDLIIASNKAIFSESFSKIGLIPGFGGTHLLINQMPWQKAVEIAFFGGNYTADEMSQLGIVNKVVDAEDLEKEAITLAAKVASGPTKVFERTKKLFLKAMNRDFEGYLEEERQVQIKSAATKDFAIGVNALNKKEKPEFIGE